VPAGADPGATGCGKRDCGASALAAASADEAGSGRYSGLTSVADDAGVADVPLTFGLYGPGGIDPSRAAAPAVAAPAAAPIAAAGRAHGEVGGTDGVVALEVAADPAAGPATAPVAAAVADCRSLVRRSLVRRSLVLAGLLSCSSLLSGSLFLGGLVGSNLLGGTLEAKTLQQRNLLRRRSGAGRSARSGCGGACCTDRAGGDGSCNRRSRTRGGLGIRRVGQGCG
jgi:hypothetical protein